MANLNYIKLGATTLGLAAIVVVILMTILIGFDSSQNVVRTASAAELNVTLGSTNKTADVGTSGQYPYLITAVCQNATGTLTAFNSSLYTVIKGDYQGGGLTLDYAQGQSDSFQNNPVDCDITYLADSTASNTLRAFINGLLIFGTFAGVVAIGLMGFGLFRMFNPGRKQL